MSYTDLETLLVTQLRTLSIYTGGNCNSDDLDGVFSYADSVSSGDYRDNVCLVDYGGGTQGSRNIWTHSASVMLSVRVQDLTGTLVQPNAGNKLRTAIELMRSLLYPNNTSVASKCRLVSLSSPIVYERSGSVWWVVFGVVEMDEQPAPRTNC